ncbi:MAG: hypothetical protein QM781_08035 [Chitinophagaceae bacterium]
MCHFARMELIFLLHSHFSPGKYAKLSLADWSKPVGQKFVINKPNPATGSGQQERTTKISAGTLSFMD